jgi:hypothetical protein
MGDDPHGAAMHSTAKEGEFPLQQAFNPFFLVFLLGSLPSHFSFYGQFRRRLWLGRVKAPNFLHKATSFCLHEMKT